MDLLKMYEGVANSPTSVLAQPVNRVDTTIYVEDASVLPKAPNIAVIGVDENAETIIYATLSGNILSGVQRDVEGTGAKAWNTGEIISRNWTNKDYSTLIDNIKLLDENTLQEAGLGLEKIGNAVGLKEVAAGKNEFDTHKSDTENPHKVTATQVGASNPNLLINGDFRVWQRGESFTNVKMTYSTDRWLFTSYDSVSKIEKVSNGVKIVPSQNGYTAVSQNLEADLLNSLIGKRITLSYAIDDNVTVKTSTFEKDLYYPNGVVFEIKNKPDPYILNWAKLELGEHATRFVPRSYGEELSLCQRYFEVIEDFRLSLGNANYTTSTFEMSVPFKVTKRIIPDVVLYDINGHPRKISVVDSTGNWIDNVEPRESATTTTITVEPIGNYKGILIKRCVADAEIY